MPGDAMIVTLSRPCLRRDAEDRAEQHAGVLAGGALAAQERAISAVRSRKALTSMPIAAAGTMPKLDSTE